MDRRDCPIFGNAEQLPANPCSSYQSAHACICVRVSFSVLVSSLLSSPFFFLSPCSWQRQLPSLLNSRLFLLCSSLLLISYAERGSHSYSTSSTSYWMLGLLHTSCHSPFSSDVDTSDVGCRRVYNRFLYVTRKNLYLHLSSIVISSTIRKSTSFIFLPSFCSKRYEL